MNAAIAIVASALCISALASQDQQPDPAFVTRTVERLADLQPALADAAMVALIRGGPQSVPVLRAVLARAKEGPARARAERALAICVVEAPVVRGLKVGLSADKTAVAEGEAVALTATLCNVSDAPIAVYVGMSYSGSVLENGLALRRLPAGKDDPPEQARFGPVGFCGTGARPLVVTLAPWSSQQLTTRATLRESSERDPGKGRFIAHDGPHLEMGFVYLPVPRGAKTVRLQLHHGVDPKQADAMGAAAAKPDWSGTFVSNELTLDLRLPATGR